MKLRNPFSGWEALDPQQRTRILKISGLVVGAFALFTLISILSYLFTWTADQSLLGDPDRLSLDVDVHNSGGKMGHQWAWLLVSRWFGLGSLLLVLVLGILAARLLLGRRSFSVIKAVLLSLTAAIIASFILAFVSPLFGLEHAFGGGLGGDCGALVVNWSKNLFGAAVTVVLLAILVASWCFFASKRFTEWFASLGSGKDPEPVRDLGEEPEPKAEKKRRGFRFVRPLEEDLPDESDDSGKQEEPSAPVAAPAVAAAPDPVAAAPAPAVEPPADDLLTRLTSGRTLSAPATVTPPAPAEPAAPAAPVDRKSVV